MWLYSQAGLQGEHPLDVPGQAHQVPFASHLVEAAQVELPEAHRRFDNPEHRLGCLFAQGVENSAFGRRQAVAHRVERRRVCSTKPVSRSTGRKLLISASINRAQIN